MFSRIWSVIIANVGPDREIVIDDATCVFKLREIGQTRNIDHQDPRSIPPDIQEDIRRRAGEPPISLGDFKPANPRIIVRDLDHLFEEAMNRDELPLDAFQKQYPTAWGFVWAYPPGYSRDGKMAVVVFEGGPNGEHGLDWTYTLGR